jgi:hypothetical protein
MHLQKFPINPLLFLFCGMWVFIQYGFSRDDDPRRTKAALKCRIIQDRFLNWIKFACFPVL